MLAEFGEKLEENCITIKQEGNVPLNLKTRQLLETLSGFLKETSHNYKNVENAQREPFVFEKCCALTENIKKTKLANMSPSAIT